MTDEELIESLRLWNRDDAADRIEALVKVRREDALELIAAHGQAHDAYEAQLKAEARAERLEAALTQIDQWAEAYPLKVFPEPDFDKVREALEAAGLSLDAVSASNMRHVIEGVGRIARTALKGADHE